MSASYKPAVCLQMLDDSGEGLLLVAMETAHK